MKDRFLGFLGANTDRAMRRTNTVSEKVDLRLKQLVNQYMSGEMELKEFREKTEKLPRLSLISAARLSRGQNL